MAVVEAFELSISHDLLHSEAEGRTCAYRVAQGQRGGRTSGLLRPEQTRSEQGYAPLTTCFPAHCDIGAWTREPRDGGNRRGELAVLHGPRFTAPGRAPRLSTVPYDEDGVAGAGARAARSQRRLERQRDKLRRNDVVETLRGEFGEQPETVNSAGNALAAGVSDAKMKRLLEEDKDMLDFEEDYLSRLTMTRKAKKARAQSEKDAGRLETIADVGTAADFVCVARDADGFGVKMEGGEYGIFGGERERKCGGKSRGILGRAMGAVGKGLAGGGMETDKRQGRKVRRQG